jgi:methionine synthase II (cobalamin-independent)
MLAQAANGITGVEVMPDGSLRVDERKLDVDAPVKPDFRRAAFGGLRAFLEVVRDRVAPVKIQLTGPVTLGLALIEAGAPARKAFAVAGTAVTAHGETLVRAVRRVAPAAPLLVFVDEPGLTALPKGQIPLSPDDTTDLLSGTLAALEPSAVTGVHCCGPTDWRVVAQAGPDLLSFPAAPWILEAGGTIASFLEDGGWIAWGAVPTSGPVSSDTEHLWRRLLDLWCDLVQFGCNPVLLRTRALITPACGLAGHGVSQAERVLRLAVELGERARGHAVSARLLAGA